MITLQEFIEDKEDIINNNYVEIHFETVGHGGDYGPLYNIDENLWLDIAQDLWYNFNGGKNV